MTQMLRKMSQFITGLALVALLLARASPQAGSPFQSFVAHGPFIISLGDGNPSAGNSGRS